MADRKISDLTALTTPASGDYLPIVDISEAAAASKNKRITIEELFRGVPLGTAAAPSIAIEGDENTGIYSPGADQLAISTNGTGRLFVDASGNVGVNTAIPINSFHVVSASSTPARIESTGSTSAIVLDNSGGQAGFWSATNDLVFFNGSFSERLRITSDGKLGLGTSSPDTLLHITNTSGGTITSGIKLKNQGSANTGISLDFDFFASSQSASRIIGLRENSADFSTALAFHTFPVAGGSSVERLRIDSSGRVGIGTTSPSGKLTVDTKTAATNAVLIAASTETGRTYGLGVNSSASFVIHEHTAASDRLVIDSSGRLLVGTSSWSGDESFVAFRSAGSGRIAIARKTFSGTADSAIGFLHFKDIDENSYAEISTWTDGAGTTGTDTPGRLVFSTTADGASSPTERMRITSDGYVRLASGTGGIQFNGDTAAANALDDYEEGTFTPTVRGTITAGTGTYTTQTGKYTKVGNLVTVTVQLTWTAHTGSGSINIQPLPFTASGATVTCALYPVNLTYNDYIAGRVISGQAVMYPYSFTSGSSISLVSLVSAGTLDFTATYYTS